LVSERRERRRRVVVFRIMRIISHKTPYMSSGLIKKVKFFFGL